MLISIPPLAINRHFAAFVRRDIYEALDVSGRPLGEQYTNAYPQLQTVRRTCPYRDHRYHHPNPMNVTTLNQVMQDWQTITLFLAQLRQQYMAATGIAVLNSADFYYLCSIGVYLAEYLVTRRQPAFAHDAIPTAVAGIFKVMLGFQAAALYRYLDDRTQPGVAAICPDAETFYRYLDNSQQLIGQSEVCAGSKMMICECYTLLTIQSAGVQASPSSQAQMQAWQIDWPQLIAFGLAAAKLKYHLILALLKAHFFCFALNEIGISHQLAVAVEHDLAAMLNDTRHPLTDRLWFDYALLWLRYAQPTAAECRTFVTTFGPEALPPPNQMYHNYRVCAVTIAEQLCHQFSPQLDHFAARLAVQIETQLNRCEHFYVAMGIQLQADFVQLRAALGFTEPSAELPPDHFVQLFGLARCFGLTRGQS